MSRLHGPLLIAAALAALLLALFPPLDWTPPRPAPAPEAAAPSHPPPRASRTRPPARTVTLSVTAYCATGNRTASGVWPRVGMAAGNRWRFGTVLRVPGWGRVTVTDRIGHSSDLDLFAPSCGAALEWGRRELAVEVVRP